jgi:AMMECR1 domain-containing protein
VEIEISILSPLRRVSAIEQIEVGTHGLLIAYFDSAQYKKSGRQGLLLPQVPVQEGWDRGEFLEGLCRKAGLPTGCWREGAELYAFTAVVFGE